jgi:uncharacterized membrane protein YgaE (UPF0421/DUF939 family)
VSVVSEGGSRSDDAYSGQKHQTDKSKPQRDLLKKVRTHYASVRYVIKSAVNENDNTTTTTQQQHNNNTTTTQQQHTTPHTTAPTTNDLTQCFHYYFQVMEPNMLFRSLNDEDLRRVIDKVESTNVAHKCHE